MFKFLFIKYTLTISTLWNMNTNDLGFIKNIYFICGVFLFIIISGSIWLYKTTRRIISIEDLPRNIYGIKLTGIVTYVGDGDGFRFYHTPWFRDKKIVGNIKTLSIRIAGIDSPEMRHWDIEEQELAVESKNYLSQLIFRKTVQIILIKIDRYSRILAMVYLPGIIERKNIAIEMVKAGMACVYIGSDFEYCGSIDKLKKTEEDAKRRKIGIWGLNNYVSPMEHKKKMRSKRKEKHKP
ncbi:putative endonuclease lcl3 [Astathelohania contejeani]|uniref:Endonuclease lcl3 n=1 Tax=Astathelohania contejeani TaxID=164912 RepID=A0ABQ7I0M6_9MICR|nr:putative endonuclease lcl3 [Thelohania contejeani]